jgi:hypothetical protein
MTDDVVSGLIGRQYGVVARGQLLDLGVHRRVIEYRTRPGGPWQRLLPGVYVTQTGAPDLNQRLMSVLLYAGPGSLLTGPAAYVLHRLGSRDLSVIHVLVPNQRQRHDTSFVRIVRTTRMPDRFVRAGPLRLVPVARAVLDTARTLTSVRNVRAVIADAVQLGRCSVRELATELNAGAIRNSALTRSVLAEVSDGVRSAAEGDLARLLARSGLPMPLLNAKLYVGDKCIAKPDAWWPEAGMVAEVDSREWHLKPQDWADTMARHNAMTALGIYLLHFPPSRLRAEGDAVIKEMRDTYARGLQRGPLAIRAVPCPK